MHGWWLISYVVLWFVVLALALLVVALARQVGTLHLRLGPRGALEIDDEGPALGSTREPLVGPDLDGRPVAVGGPGEPSLILFVSPDCPVCHEVLPSIPAVARAGRIRPVVVVDATPEEAAVAVRARRLPPDVVVSSEIGTAYAVPGTPYAVVLDGAGAVRAKGTVNNLEQMEGLLDTADRRLEEVGA